MNRLGQIYRTHPINAPAFGIDIGRIYQINRINASAFDIDIGRIYPMNASAFDIDIVADGGRDGERIFLRFHA